eukprot:gene45305-64673_t
MLTFFSPACPTGDDRACFGCPSTKQNSGPGQGLVEAEGGDGTEISHWEKRVFGNEGMTGIDSDTHEALWSEVTLAYFEDTGHYEADYRKGPRQLI